MIAGIGISIANGFGSANDYLEMYSLGVAVGSMIVAPLSERYGRLPIYHTTNFLFIGTLLACSKACSLEMLLILRVVSGVTGCSSLVLGGPTIRDIVYADHQCRSRMLWSLCRLSPLFGFVASQYGTVIGRSLVVSMEWRDVFRILAASVRDHLRLRRRLR